MAVRESNSARPSHRTNSTTSYGDMKASSNASGTTTTTTTNAMRSSAVVGKENQLQGSTTTLSKTQSTIDSREELRGSTRTDLMSSLIIEMTRSIEEEQGNTSSKDAEVTSGIGSAASSTSVQAENNNNKRTKRKKASSTRSSSSGRWTNEEHQAFLDGLRECGREWKKVAQRIPTRTSSQIRSHAQKYFAKIKRERAMTTEDRTNNGNSTNKRSRECSVDDSAINTSAQQQQEEEDEEGICSEIPLTPSVRRNVQRILEDPEAAQREVENTLSALRDRYRELQAQLQLRRRQEGMGIAGNVVINGFNLVQDSNATEQERRIQQQQVRQHYTNHVQNERRKRTLEDTTTSTRTTTAIQTTSHPNSSVAGSSSGATGVPMTPSLTTSSPRRINDGEFIAVQVLLGACASKVLPTMTTATASPGATTSAASTTQQQLPLMAANQSTSGTEEETTNPIIAGNSSSPSLGSVGPGTKKRRLSDEE